MGFYHERDEEKTITNDSSPNDEELIKRMTPEFQRDADKWSLERKITFVENVISGFRTEITLYSINESDSNSSCLDDCFILDGLQRLTAII